MSILMRAAWRGLGSRVGLGLVIAAAFWATGAEATQQDSAQAEKGKRIFQKYCVACHGREGTGDGYRMIGVDPANLTSRQTQEQSDEDLLESIHEGKPMMPPWKDQLSNEDRQRVLAYIRSLAK
jgi:mono/diheme cytochrome c family protein